MNIAQNHTDFVNTVSEAIQTALNNEAGQQMTAELLRMKLDDNPNLTPEEWTETKQQFFVFMFHQVMKEHPELMKEYAGHVYDELSKQEEY